MRTSKLITISLPPAMVAAMAKISKKKSMTRSELFRNALRRYIEELYVDEVVREADAEFRTGKAKILPRGGLVSLMRKR